MNRKSAQHISRTMKALVKKQPRFNLNEIRVIVAMERAIARLALSRELSEHLIFKGGFVLLKTYDSLRFTRDADALAVSIPKMKLKDLVCNALEVDLEDGLWFGDIQVENFTEQGEYGAYRFDCAFQIGPPDFKKIHKLSRVHIDINFSDHLPTKPADQIMPSVLEHQAPVHWKIYPIEYIVAEKLQTLFERGSANSRAKDIYDLIYLSSYYHGQDSWISAIQETFKNRRTSLPESFAQKAEQFDKTILKAAWPGVIVKAGKMEFEEAWKTLANHLKALDGHSRTI